MTPPLATPPPASTSGRSVAAGARWALWLDRGLVLYAVALVAYLPLRWIGRGWIPPVVVASAFLPFFLAAGAPLALVALARRRLGSAAVLALGAVAFVVVFGERFVDESAAASVWIPPAGTPLRVVTLNLGDDLTQPEEVIAFLRETDADLIALQEVGPQHPDALEVGLADLYPHQVAWGLGCAGMGLLSRHPLRDPELFRLSASREYLRAYVDVDGRDVLVLVVHPMAWIGPFGKLGAGASDLPMLAREAAAASPGLLLGDLNTTETTCLYDGVVDAGLVDAYRATTSAFGFTFPVGARWHHIPVPPVVRLDYVLHTPDVRTGRCWIGRDVGSDHFPLLADLVLAPEE